MDDLLKEAAKQAPALALMVVVVWMFIKHLASRDASMRDGYKTMFNEHLDARNESREVIQENTKALRENAETRGQVTEVIRQLKEKL